MTTIYEYVTAPSGRIHLIVSKLPEAERTLCDREIDGGAYFWERGDETQSGHQATCRVCRRAAGPTTGAPQ
jgi:hypothetical protein